MGAKTWMVVYSDGNPRGWLNAKPELDRDATLDLARKLFPSEKLSLLDDGNLMSANPPDDEIVIGCFSGVSVVAAKEFALDRPSQLDTAFLRAGSNGTIHLHAMHSVVDWFAFAVWNAGKLQRSLSVAPDNGVIEDVGARMAFEQPYWNGEHPAVDPDEADEYPLPFHPLELGEAALSEFFGYQLEGYVEGQPDPELVKLMRFKRLRSRWRLW